MKFSAGSSISCCQIAKTDNYLNHIKILSQVQIIQLELWKKQESSPLNFDFISKIV